MIIFIVCGMFCMDLILNCTYFFQYARVCISLYTASPSFPVILSLCLLLFLVKENKMHFKYVSALNIVTFKPRLAKKRVPGSAKFFISRLHLMT